MIWRIILGMGIGIIVGYMINTATFGFSGPSSSVIEYLKLISSLFLRAIKMIIAPLIFSTLVVGIAQMGSGKEIGRVGIKAMLWFFIASVISLSLGLIFANLFEPGMGIRLSSVDTASNLTNIASNSKHLGFSEFVKEQIIPTSIFDALSGNKVLQIVFFAMFFGVAAASLGKTGLLVVKFLDEISHIMIKTTTYIMKMAPIAVFAAISATIAEKGLGIMLLYTKFIGSFFFALSILWLLFIGIGMLFLGSRIWSFLKEIKEAFLLSFATASSEAAYPKILDALDRFGVSRKISSFIMPLGYSFNLDGSMMYCAFASLFVAQLYGIELTLGTQILMLLTLMLTSKGVAAVPSASLVVIYATLAQFGLPVEGIVFIMAVDRFLDMGRSATNAVGNSLASAVIAKWEGELLSEEDAKKLKDKILLEEEASLDHHLS